MLETLGTLEVKVRGIRAPVGPSTSEDTTLDTLARTHLQGARFERQVVFVEVFDEGAGIH